MNQKGSLTSWNDAKGFGFITPEGGGERIFAHISSYAGRGRPAPNRKVTYSITKDAQGRPRAGRFQYAGAAKVGASIAPGVWLAVLTNLGALGWLLVAPEAMSLRQQLGFDLSESLRPLVW
ncbi:MAG: cold shock domain-containing protein [Marinobacter sp.]